MWSRASRPTRTGRPLQLTLALLFEVVAELLAAGGVAQLGEGLGLDLADALAGDPELAADLLEGAGVAVGEAEAELDDLLLPLREGVQDRVELLLEQDEAGRVDRDDGVGVLDEVAEVGVLLLADRGLQRHRLLGHLEDLADLLGRELHLAADLLGGGLAAQVLEELTLDADELVDRLDHVHRDADGAGLVGDGPGDGLADPPGGVGGELEALVVRSEERRVGK